MHIWLDPGNAKVLAAAIASALGDADPRNAAIYRANAERLRQRLDELDRSLHDRLATVADRPYVVFHDAYQYFEHRYGVNAVGAITINPTVRPSAQRLGKIHERLEQIDAACVFAEPQFEPTLVDTVIEGTSAQTGVLDPLGAALDAGPDQYFQLHEQPRRLPGQLPWDGQIGLMVCHQSIQRGCGLADEYHRLCRMQAGARSTAWARRPCSTRLCAIALGVALVVRPAPVRPSTRPRRWVTSRARSATFACPWPRLIML